MSARTRRSIRASPIASAVVNLKTGKALAFADYFPDSAKADLAATCTAAIRAEKEKRYKDIGDADTTKMMMDGLDAQMADNAIVIEGGVANMSLWTIYDDRAEVYFDTGDLGDDIEGSYTCALPKTQLQKLATVSPWPVP